ncbi:MAG: class I tRNA ligase family protein, partial [Elusimicrobia bacterium]|nr:class I tRNA ligase family protein [Elusimicrobiota bacterium]
FEQAKPWDMRSIEGVHRFLKRAFVLINDLEAAPAEGEGLVALRHRTIKKVGEDIESFGFNTAISSLMIYLNALQADKAPSKLDLDTFLILLNPFAPHLTEELWSKLGHEELLCRQPWPSWDAKHLVDSTIEYPVQVNGKLRDTFTIAADAPDELVKETAIKLAKVQNAVGAQKIVKIILIPKKLVSLVVK